MRVFANAGYSVLTAKDGVEALEGFEAAWRLDSTASDGRGDAQDARNGAGPEIESRFPELEDRLHVRLSGAGHLRRENSRESDRFAESHFRATR